MAPKGSGADRVQAIANDIAALPPAEKQRLIQLLIDGGHLPGGSAPLPSQLSLGASSRTGPSDYIVTFDGGSRGNPGPGYGSYAITRVQDGAQRLERLNLGEPTTNNEAEYDTLITALQDLLRRIDEAGRRPEEFALEVRGDSALVLNQVQGRWKAKEPRMRERRNRCVALLQRFENVRFEALPREQIVRVLGH